MNDDAADALQYALVSPGEAIRNYRRRQAIIEAHPDWTPDQVDAHYELTRPPDPAAPFQAAVDAYKASLVIHAGTPENPGPPLVMIPIR